MKSFDIKNTVMRMQGAGIGLLFAWLLMKFAPHYSMKTSMIIFIALAIVLIAAFIRDLKNLD